MSTRSRTNLRDVDRAFIHTVMFQMGILPMEKTNLDMRRALQQLPPEEARTLKRKFRKMWRRAMRNEVGNGKRRSAKASAANQRLGVGRDAPSRAERNARKQLVFDQVWEKIIEPMLKRFENPTKEDLFSTEKKP